MLLSALLPSAPAIEVSGIAYDSRRVEPGWLFVAMPRVPEDKAPGQHMDGHDFVRGAFERGAAAALVEHQVAGIEGAQVVVPSTRVALADAAAAFYGHPGNKL